MSAVEAMSDAELLAITGGCTELTCIYHHEAVTEIRRRRTTTTTTEGHES